MVRKRKGFIFKNMMKGVKYPLIDVKEPELYREQFPYEQVPRVFFDGKDVPLSPAADGSFTFADTNAPPGAAFYRAFQY